MSNSDEVQKPQVTFELANGGGVLLRDLSAISHAARTIQAARRVRVKQLQAGTA